MIKLYGAERCKKTQHYKTFFLKNRVLNFEFLDVEQNLLYAKELRNLYKSRKLNFPTIIVGDKNYEIQQIKN